MTNEEIVKALRQCAKSDCSSCGMCPIFPDRECVEHLVTAAASLIEQLIDENTELREEVNLRGNAVRTYEKKRAEAAAERDALREKKRWIPVAERLPKKQAWYHVAIRDKKTMRVSVEQDLYSVETAKNFGHEIGFCKANRWPEREELIAWMPLPDAPEEGEKE